MSTLDTLKADLKTAMKAKDTVTRDTIRLLLTAVKQVEVDQRKELSEDEVQKLMVKQAKQRRESITEYEKAGRTERAEPEKAELAVIEKYLPEMMSREEVMAIAQQVIAGVDTSNPKAMGALVEGIISDKTLHVLPFRRLA